MHDAPTLAAAPAAPRLRHAPVAAVAVLAFAARVAWIATTDFTPSVSDDAGRYDLLGRSLAHGGGYINPNGATTAFWPPGYPFILTAVYRLYPHWLLGNHEVKAALLLNAALGAGTVLLVYAIGARAFGRRVALLGAMLTALFPSLVFFAGVTLSETAFTFVALLAVWLLVEAEAREDRRLLVLAGLSVGFAALIRGQAALLPLVAVPFWWMTTRSGPQMAQTATDGTTGAGYPQMSQMTQMEEDEMRAVTTGVPWRAVLMRIAAVGVPAALVVLPWSVRNYVESGAPVLISSNAGVDFYVGHSAAADGRGRIVDELVFRYPGLPPAEAEAKVSADGFREGLKYAVRHPVREVTLAVRKVFWLYERDDEAVSWIDGHGERYVLSRGARAALQVLSDAYYYVLIALAALGVRRWFSLRDPVRLLLVSLVVYWTLVHVAFFADPRFHAPIMPVLALWAAAGTARVLSADDADARRWGGRETTDSTDGHR